VNFEQLTLDWCYSCWRAEPIPPSGAYISCFECGHAYETAQELLAAYNAEIDRFNASGMSISELAHSEDADAIVFCPLCMHDF
jgi:hypothetical protein